MPCRVLQRECDPVIARTYAVGKATCRTRQPRPSTRNNKACLRAISERFPEVKHHATHTHMKGAPPLSIDILVGIGAPSPPPPPPPQAAHILTGRLSGTLHHLKRPLRRNRQPSVTDWKPQHRAIATPQQPAYMYAKNLIWGDGNMTSFSECASLRRVRPLC